MSDEIISRLSRLDACALSDALDRLALPPAVTGIAPRTLRRRIAGRALTVKLVAGTPPPAAPARHLCTAAVEAAEPGDIIVIEQRTGIDAAGWGGILSNAAAARGLSGVVVDGPARDIDEAHDLGFPVYARSTTARTARGRIYEAETGTPVAIGDATVRPGDYVVADSSGVIVVAAADIGRVLDAAERIAAREAAMTKAVLAGAPVGEVMGADYEHMLTRKD